MSGAGSEWVGPFPLKCDICDMRIVKAFIDGRTERGPWAILCPLCHLTHGVGLGTGLGQSYRKQGTKFVKVGG